MSPRRPAGDKSGTGHAPRRGAKPGASDWRGIVSSFAVAGWPPPGWFSGSARRKGAGPGY